MKWVFTYIGSSVIFSSRCSAVIQAVGFGLALFYPAWLHKAGHLGLSPDWSECGPAWSAAMPGDLALNWPWSGSTTCPHHCQRLCLLLDPPASRSPTECCWAWTAFWGSLILSALTMRSDLLSSFSTEISFELRLFKQPGFCVNP